MAGFSKEVPFGLTKKCSAWTSREMIGYFMNYCRAVFTRSKGKVKYYLTFNEINSATAPMGTLLDQGILNGLESPRPSWLSRISPSSASRACIICFWPAPRR